MNSMLETSFRKRSLGHLGTSFSGVLYKKKGNASLYKITSVLKDGRTPSTVWREREFTITSDGTLSYTKSTGSKGHSLELRDCFLRLGCPLQDKNGGYHVHVHTVDGAPTPFTFEIGLRFGLEASWSLCARTDKEMIEWIRCILSHMYPISMELLLGAPLSGLAETSSDPQLIGDNLSPIPEDNMNSVQTPNQTRSPMIRKPERSMAMHHPHRQSSNLLSNPTVVGESFGTTITITWVRILEIGMGFLLFNLLIFMIMFAVPGSPEAWLFAAAVNLLVSFALLVRLEQIMISPGADESSNFSRLVSSANVRTQSLPAGLFQHQNTLASNSNSGMGGNTRSTMLVSHGSGLTDAHGDSSGEDENVDEVAVIEGDLLSIPSNSGLSNGQVTKRSLASSSLRVSQSAGDSPSAGSNENESVFTAKHSYGVVDAASLMVRVGPNYRRERRKGPSECALMTLVGCDLYYSKDKIDCIAEKLIFPEPSNFTVRASSPAETPAAMCRPHPSGLPHFFVFNLQIQDQGPTLFGAKNSSGYTLACYFEPSEEFVRDVTDMVDGKACSNASRLAHSWLTSFHKDQAMRERLKLKATIVNESAIDSLGWASKYNGKPAMITKSNTMTRLQGRTQQGRICEVIEADVDLRMWNLLFRQGLSTVLPNVGKLSFNLALVIEGESDDELPERVLGAVQLNYLDLQAVSSWD